MSVPAHEIYLDYNATTPVLPAARDAAVRALQEQFGNPSSSHCTGLRAKSVLDAVRACAERVLGVGEGNLLFVSGATEGIQTAVLSALSAVRARRDAGESVTGPLLVGATEHKAVPLSVAHWNHVLGLHLPVLEVPVDRQGRHDLAWLRAQLPTASLLCTMAANNETGVVSDLAGLEAVLTQSGSRALWVVDCVQALGKLALNLSATRIDYAPFSGHKLYAPKGIGMLYVRQGSPYTPLMAGGGQEGGQRSGTENMPGIAALGAVLEVLEAGGDAVFRSHAYLEWARQRLAAALQAAWPGLVFNMPMQGSLPTTLNFAVPGLSSKQLLNVFDAAGMRVSAGSACSATKAEPSHVLQAMGLPAWQTLGAVRLSIGAVLDDGVIDEACARIARCGQALSPEALVEQPPQFALSAAAVADLSEQAGVRPQAVAAFLRQYPQAQLVDVRDASEHAVSDLPAAWSAPHALHMPLAQLPYSHLATGPRPLLLFCRSGARSRLGVAWLRAQGHAQSWHIEGGLALAGMV